MSELLASPNPDWLIAGLIPARSLTVFYGAPGAGKTFVALNMALSISAGLHWLDHNIQPGPVIYCTPEGLSDLRQRVLAWQTHNNVMPENFGYIIEAPQLADPGEVDSLINSIQAIHPRPADVTLA